MLNNLRFRFVAVMAWPRRSGGIAVERRIQASNPGSPISRPPTGAWPATMGCRRAAGEDISIGLAWRPTMMANAARDPYWHAGVRRETIDHPESRAAIEDECSICHMPMARFESKLGGHEGTVFSHLGFLPDERGDRLAADGVSCSLCHQIGKEKLGTRESFVGGFVIGGPTPQGERLEFGPFAPDAGHARIMRTSTGGFRPTESPHIRAERGLRDLPHSDHQERWDRAARRSANCRNRCPTRSGSTANIGKSEAASRATCRWLRRMCRSPACWACRGPASPGTCSWAATSSCSGILNRYRNELSVAALPEELTAAAQRTVAHLQSEAARVSIGRVEVRARAAGDRSLGREPRRPQAADGLSFAASLAARDRAGPEQPHGLRIGRGECGRRDRRQ